ncbi:MAG: type I-E CRISPR-associated protein Cse2/CasB [Candidatus Aquicultor sp.]|nr:type I-E CRISPR-associated protein Cse2/CasB [Candidatus Aquicultor sp.]
MSFSYLRFDIDSPEFKALTDWWRELENNRGDRAVLRRCRSLTEVVFSPAYHRLRWAVSRFGSVDDNGLALIVGLAARIKSNSEGSSIAEQMATGKSDGSARVSGLRFRRLLKVQEKDDLFTAMARIIALLGGTTNLQSLVQSVYFWNDRTRKQWAFDYYSRAPEEA